MNASIFFALSSTEFPGAIIFAVAFPPLDDATEVDLSVHMLQHVVIILSVVMIAYPFFKKGPWNFQVYQLFSVANQAIRGWVLLLSGRTFPVGVAYILTRNPRWLDELGGKGEREPARTPTGNTVRVPSWVASGFSVILIFTRVSYFAATGLALTTAAGPPAESTTVYIIETPMSWNYSPQNATVLLGVYSTLTWLSRSISYDTVTGDSGLFGPGPIPPGGTFTYSFTQPGV